MPHSIKPFHDEETVTQINGLTVENRLDRLSIYGTVDLTRDKIGLGKALVLKSIIDEVCDILQAQELPDVVVIDHPKTVKNPF